MGLYIYSIFLYELADADIINKQDLTDDVFSLIEDLRQRMVHKKPMKNTKLTQHIKSDMEIDFEHYIYDNAITVENNNKSLLYSINFGVWDLITMDSGMVTTFNQLALIPEEGMKVFLRDKIGPDVLFDLLEKQCERIAIKAEKLFNPVKYSYASGVLFKNPEPCEKDKLTILFYYTFVKLFSMTTLFVPIDVISFGSIEINIRQSMLKYRATLIELIGNDIRHNNTKLSNEIKDRLEEVIDHRWYSLNRKLRNNIHYGETKVISSSELAYIESYQYQYYKTILSIFDNHINYSLGRKYKTIKWIADHTDTSMREKNKL